ncbi:MAG: c-type cytochrome [Gammaproteobacteria bacterium]
MSLQKIKALLFIPLLCLAPWLLAAPSPSYNIANGKKIYDKSCFTCHAAGVADAPKTHDVDAWKERFMMAAKAEKTDPQSATAMDYLVNQVVKGKMAMPPKGLCNNCSNSDFADAIQYMASAQQ